MAGWNMNYHNLAGQAILLQIVNIYLKINKNFEPAVPFGGNLTCSNKGTSIKGIYIAILFVIAKPGNMLIVYQKWNTSRYIHTTVCPNHSRYQKERVKCVSTDMEENTRYILRD